MTNETEKETREKTPWHRWFGELFRVLLIPLGLDVKIGHPVMRDSPEVDVLITGKGDHGWTDAQRRRLPDGLIDADADHLILELKYSESLNEDAVFQAAGYHYFYKTHNKLKTHEIQVFLISSRTPQEETLRAFGYGPAEKAGLFRSTLPVCSRLPLISLNDLSDRARNVPLKLFASKKRETLRAAEMLSAGGLMERMPQYLGAFLKELLKILFEKGGTMDWLNMTPEEKEAVRQGWLETIRTEFTPEEVMSRFRPEDRLAGLRPEDRLAGLRPEEIEAYLKKIKRQTEH